ncbi:Putative metallo-hydrolase YycJ [Phycisphaerales bacterium]|nr:Putative metallo-hydrolase YycJ [Phycisphaerales bacterium]
MSTPDIANPWSASLCVLSSSSGGNCSALRLERRGERRLILIDAGLSPRRTRRLLRQIGEHETPVAAVLLTHLDSDHWHESWLRLLPEPTRVLLHSRHRGRAAREGLLHGRAELFSDEFELLEGVRISTVLMAHDEVGVAVFRIEPAGAGALGFATDVGRATSGLVEHLADVDVLAIESNYCPEMQVASDRPAFLKARIMGGAGHLSNQESAEAIRRIGPREHVVLLHLSRQCNTPETAARVHAGWAKPITIARPDAPTPWIPIRCPDGTTSRASRPILRTSLQAVIPDRLPFPSNA